MVKTVVHGTGYKAGIAYMCAYARFYESEYFLYTPFVAFGRSYTFSTVF